MSDDKEEVEQETVTDIYDDDWAEDDMGVDCNGHTTINTEGVIKNTVALCPKCNAKTYLKNGKCVRCDYELI